MRGILLSLLLMLFVSVPVYGQKKVFILNSYHKTDTCGGPRYQGVLKALTENIHSDIQIGQYFLDSKRLSEKQIKKIIAEALDKIKNFHPDLLVVVDDLAFQVALKNFLGSKNMFIVFSGVNSPLEEYNEEFHFLEGLRPTKNVIGVYEHLFTKEQIEFLELIFGENFKIALLHSTDLMGNILKNQVITELKATPYLNKIKIFPISNLKDLQKTIKKLAHKKEIKAYMPYTMSVRDEKNKRHLTIKEIAPILINNLSILDVSANNKIFARLGFFGGVGPDFFAMGYQAGIMATKLLQNYPFSRLRVEYARNYCIIINKKRAEQCNVHLPPDILNLADEVIE